jgi:hypothetical protein
MKSVITKLLALILIACSSPSFAAVKTIRLIAYEGPITGFTRLTPLYEQIFAFSIDTYGYLLVKAADLYDVRADFNYYRINSLSPYFGLSPRSLIVK